MNLDQQAERERELSGTRCPGSGQFGLWTPNRYLEDGDGVVILAPCAVCGARIEVTDDNALRGHNRP